MPPHRYDKRFRVSDGPLPPGAIECSRVPSWVDCRRGSEPPGPLFRRSAHRPGKLRRGVQIRERGGYFGVNFKHRSTFFGPHKAYKQPGVDAVMPAITTQATPKDGLCLDRMESTTASRRSGLPPFGREPCERCLREPVLRAGRLELSGSSDPSRPSRANPAVDQTGS